MPTQIFVNLPVKDLAKSKVFFSALGFTFSAQFTDDSAACMVVTDSIFYMLLTEQTFKRFTAKEICDTSRATEVLNALGMENRQAVDDMVRKAGEAGGKPNAAPVDHGFMYQHGFEDLDGHTWELCYMDPSYVQ